MCIRDRSRSAENCIVHFPLIIVKTFVICYTGIYNNVIFNNIIAPSAHRKSIAGNIYEEVCAYCLESSAVVIIVTVRRAGIINVYYIFNNIMTEYYVLRSPSAEINSSRVSRFIAYVMYIICLLYTSSLDNYIICNNVVFSAAHAY